MKREDLYREVDILVNGHWVTMPAHYLDDPEGMLRAIEEMEDEEELDQEALFW